MPSMHLSQIRRWLLQSPPVEWAILHLRDLLIGALRQGPIPQHVAFVMDGNRRFARTHGIETVEGHNLGFEALARVRSILWCAMSQAANTFQILEVCYKSGVKVVTVYAFSIENFKRSKYEVDALMAMAKVKLSQLAQHGDLLDRYGASVRVLGQRDLLKPDVIEAMDKAVSMTQHNKQAILNVCVPYTSHDEITTAIRDTVIDYSRPLPSQQRSFSESHITHNIRARRLSAATLKVRSHSPSSGATSDTDDSISSSTTLYPDSPPEEPVLPQDYDVDIKPWETFSDPETITSEVLNEHMFTADLPPLELLVRTSGVERLSDFMLWQCHQDTDIVFLKCLWPDFDLWTFLPVLVEWQWKRRMAEEKVKGIGVAGKIKAG